MSQILLPLVENGKRIDGYFFDPSTEIVYFFKSIAGKKIKFSTKIKKSSYRKAQSFANNRLREIFGEGRSHIQPIIADEIKKWLLVKQSENLDPRTMQKISQGIKRIEPFWGNKFPREIDADSFAEWMKWLDKEFPGQLKFNSLKQFRGLCRYLHSKQHNKAALLPAIPRIFDPEHKTNAAARKKKTERILTKKEFRKILKVATDTEKLAALIMYTMATRIEETLSMSFGEQVVRKGRGWEYVWSIGQNKADLHGRHDFPDTLNIPLCERYEEFNEYKLVTARLFPQERDKSQALKPQQIDWADWRTRANLGWHWTSKTFRHTCLSNLFNDARYSQVVLCQQYRISLKVAAETYVKPTLETLKALKNASAQWV